MKFLDNEVLRSNLSYNHKNHINCMKKILKSFFITQTCKIVMLLSLAIYFPPSQIKAGIIDDVSKSVVFLSDNIPVEEVINGISYDVILKNHTNNDMMIKQNKISGSGLIVTSSNICYLVTAKHVALEMSDNCTVIMGGDKNTPLQFTLASLVGQPNVHWFHDDTADISVFPLPTVTLQSAMALAGRAIPLGMLESGTNLPSRDDFVTALGFPLSLGAQGQFYPLTRESKVSSGMLNDDKGYFFLLQDPSVSGYSGGSLFDAGEPKVEVNANSVREITPGAHCWGFIFGNYSDEKGGKMCRVTPAFYAVQIIQKIEKTTRDLCQ